MKSTDYTERSLGVQALSESRQCLIVYRTKKKCTFLKMAHHLFILSVQLLICDIRETVVPVLLTLHTFYEYECSGISVSPM